MKIKKVVLSESPLGLKISTIGLILIQYNDLVNDLDFKTSCKICLLMNIIKLEVYNKLNEFRVRRNDFAHQSLSCPNIFECGNKLEKEFIKKGEIVYDLGGELIKEIFGNLLKNQKKVHKLTDSSKVDIEKLLGRKGELRKYKND